MRGESSATRLLLLTAAALLPASGLGGVLLLLLAHVPLPTRHALSEGAARVFLGCALGPSVLMGFALLGAVSWWATGVWQRRRLASLCASGVIPWGTLANADLVRGRRGRHQLALRLTFQSGARITVYPNLGEEGAEAFRCALAEVKQRWPDQAAVLGREICKTARHFATAGAGLVALGWASLAVATGIYGVVVHWGGWTVLAVIGVLLVGGVVVNWIWKRAREALAEWINLPD